ncbi:hypothetical protein RQP46_007538 [Phenoliferia psychrophenolica]
MSRDGIHGLWFLFPLAACVAWAATLLGLLLWWVVDDHAMQYKIDEATVGAAHQGLFIPGAALTFIAYSGTLVTERWLRGIQRLPAVLDKSGRWTGVMSLVFGIAGGLSLLLLSIFNAFEHTNIHWCMTAAFVVCVSISAACQTLETLQLVRDHGERAYLRRNAVFKIIIVAVAVALAVIFGTTCGICYHTMSLDGPPTGKCNIVESLAASTEWLIAFVLDAYFFTLVLDLWPARKTRGHGSALGDPSRPYIIHVDHDRCHQMPQEPNMVHIHMGDKRAHMRTNSLAKRRQENPYAM